jgi:hypothetical protein
MNALVTAANAGVMPVVGMPSSKQPCKPGVAGRETRMNPYPSEVGLVSGRASGGRNVMNAD